MRDEFDVEGCLGVMKITFVLPQVDLSGGVRVVATYARRLADRGHDVVVVSTPAPRPSLRDAARMIVKERRLPAAVTPAGPSHLDGAGLEHRVIDRARAIEDRDVPD